MVSVCMATCNGERFIEKQILSILKQIGSDDELIISDDSSIDATIDIIKKINDNRIVLLENQTFRNPLWNFNNAISKAKHDIIFLSDQDDIWVDGKVETMKAALNDFDLVVSDRVIIDADDRILLQSYAGKFSKRFRPGLINNLMFNSYVGCCMAFRSEILKKALPFPKNIGWHDWWLGIVANTYYKVGFIEKPLTLHRQHDQNVSYGSSLKSENALFKKFLMRWNIVKYVPCLLMR